VGVKKDVKRGREKLTTESRKVSVIECHLLTLTQSKVTFLATTFQIKCSKNLFDLFKSVYMSV
jgi:hypothetical protein